MMTSCRRQPLPLLCVLAALATALAHHGLVTAEAALSSTALGCDRARGTNCTCSECPARNGFHAYCATTMQCLRSEADCGQCPDADQCVALSNCSGIPTTPAPAPVPTYSCDGLQCMPLEKCQAECDGNCAPCAAPPPPPPTGYTCGGQCYADYGLCRLACEGGCSPCNSSSAPTTPPAPAPPGPLATTYNCDGRCLSLELCQAECAGNCPPCAAPPPPPPSGFSCGARCFASAALCRFECGGDCGACTQ